MRLPLVLGGLRIRLVVAFALVAVVATVTTGALAFRAARTGLLQQGQDTVITQFRDAVDSLAPSLTFPPAQDDLQVFADQIAHAQRTTDWRVMVTYQGRTATSAPGDAFTELTPAMRASVRDRSATVFQRVSTAHGPALVVGLPVGIGTPDQDRGLPPPSGVAVFLTVPQNDAQGYVDSLVSAVERATVPALLVAVLLALLAARGVLRPVRALRGATRRIAEGHLETRLAVHGSDELADLSHTFNDTAAALESSVADLRRMEGRARRFAADVSHELRTPLAAMAAVTDVLDEDAAQLDRDTATAVRLISEETGKLVRLVDDLMEISRFDAGAASLHLDEVDLAESVLRTLAARGWQDTVGTELPPPDTARGIVDPRRLDVIVANLAGNALRHGELPVRVRMSVRAADAPGAAGASGADRVAVIEVTDSGPGIPQDVLPHVFDRFYKSDTSRTRTEGSGLGLSITAENVHLHGGTITAANSPAGGAVFTVTLPLRRDV
ncbi:sensor histidine kinase [Actinacidiphila epipremni]|uniref:histidine kinase n=1 Tax=Actinacidiphila epipremni TaxID=2053013 RepID=A0ABX0ZNL6_9ACTN|nr:HAMP domain-containing sensor histidine kinase [Actinacidiphila epipremni]NJP43193.1 HAMP domain-containing histidine kinase [Actinacidiphila epipremni]